MQRANKSYLPFKSKQGKRPRVDGVSAVTMTVETDDDRNGESAWEFCVCRGEKKMDRNIFNSCNIKDLIIKKIIDWNCVVFRITRTYMS